MKAFFFSSFVCVAAAAAIAPAVLQTRCTDPPPNPDRAFSVAASRAHCSIDTAALAANGRGLYLHANTSTYCPSAVGPTCADFTSNVTVISCVDWTGAPTVCWMSVTVPGGQQMYVDPADGRLGYTQAHSSGMPSGALTSGFTYSRTDSRFSFTGAGAAGLVACPNNPKCSTHPKAKGCDPWSVRAALPQLEALQTHCLRFEAFTTGQNVSAWQYT